MTKTVSARIIISAGCFYTLKKRLADLKAFAEYFTAKSEGIKFVKLLSMASICIGHLLKL